MTHCALPQLSNDALGLAVDRARVYAEAAHAPTTRRAYAVGWADFTAYCTGQGFDPVPASPQSVALYVTALAERGLKLASIRLYLAAIAHGHRDQGLASPTGHVIVRRVLRGIARTIGSAPVKKSAVTVDILRAMLLEIRGNDLKAKRDRALVLLGFAAALRRSELAVLDIDDLRFCKQGVVVTVRRSKTDPQAQGCEIAVPYVANKSLCAVRAVKAWLDASGLSQGPLFHSFDLRRNMLDKPITGKDVANLVKHLTARARLDGDFSGHSLRAGFVTSAAAAKASLDSIQRTTRHRSVGMLLGYVRPAQAFDDTALSVMFT